jgi:hypothetical protein
MLLFALDTSMSHRSLRIKFAEAVVRQKADAEENARLTKALDTATVELERLTGELVALQRIHNTIAQGPEGAKRGGRSLTTRVAPLHSFERSVMSSPKRNKNSFTKHRQPPNG